jgi:hypothetical protein
MCRILGLVRSCRRTPLEKDIELMVLRHEVRPDFGATFASSQVDGIAARKCFHYA